MKPWRPSRTCFVCALSRSRDVATRQNSRTAPLILPSERSLHDLLVVDLCVRSRGATFGADLPLPGLRVRSVPRVRYVDLPRCLRWTPWGETRGSPSAKSGVSAPETLAERSGVQPRTRHTCRCRCVSCSLRRILRGVVDGFGGAAGPVEGWAHPRGKPGGPCAFVCGPIVRISVVHVCVCVFVHVLTCVSVFARVSRCLAGFHIGPNAASRTLANPFSGVSLRPALQSPGRAAIVTNSLLSIYQTVDHILTNRACGAPGVP